MFYFDKINNKVILKSDYLIGIKGFFTTKDSFFTTKDADLEKITEENKKTIGEYLNISNFVSPVQTHSCNVDFVKPDKYDYPDTDALILDNDRQAVFLNFADCTPVILYDKKQKIAAVSHAGWRGTAKKIVPKTIKKMNSNPADIIAIIGPAISLCCYNVGKDVFNELKSSVDNFEGLYKLVNEQIFVDLKAINERQMREIGVRFIDVCPYCTCCDNDMFFSYRKENATTNRHNAVIRL